MTEHEGMEARDLKGDLWPTERERDIFERGYKLAIKEAAKVAETYSERQNPDGEYVPTAAVNMCWREIADAIRQLGVAHNEGKG